MAFLRQPTLWDGVFLTRHHLPLTTNNTICWERLAIEYIISRIIRTQHSFLKIAASVEVGFIKNIVQQTFPKSTFKIEVKAAIIDNNRVTTI